MVTFATHLSQLFYCKLIWLLTKNLVWSEAFMVRPRVIDNTHWLLCPNHNSCDYLAIQTNPLRLDVFSLISLSVVFMSPLTSTASAFPTQNSREALPWDSLANSQQLPYYPKGFCFFFLHCSVCFSTKVVQRPMIHQSAQLTASAGTIMFSLGKNTLPQLFLSSFLVTAVEVVPPSVVLARRLSCAVCIYA